MTEPSYLRIMLAGTVALVTGCLSLAWFGTAWWSVAIAVVSAVATYAGALRQHQPEVARG